LKDFHKKLGELSDFDQFIELRSILKPLMLHRLKGDVEKSLHPLEDIIIECSMTQHQNAYYKSIYSRNMEYLTGGVHKTNSTNLQNIQWNFAKSVIILI
jgi:SNF2 family DNA or RNA helicase